MIQLLLEEATFEAVELYRRRRDMAAMQETAEAVEHELLLAELKAKAEAVFRR